MKKFLSIVLAIALGLSLCTMAFAATNATPQAVVTVTLDTAGGNAILPLSGETGSAMTVPTPVWAGHTFTGWTPTPSATFPSVNATLVATWTVVTTARTSTVVFILNNGQVNIEVTGTPGSTLASNPAVPTKTGYTFGSWNPAIASVVFPSAGLTTYVNATWVPTEVVTTVVVPTVDSAQAWLDLALDEGATFLKDPQVKAFAAQAKDIVNKGATGDISTFVDDLVKTISDKTGVDVGTIKGQLADSEIFNWFAKIYIPGEKATTTVAVVPETTTEATVIPDTGSAVGGIAIFATLSIAAAAAFVCSKKN